MRIAVALPSQPDVREEISMKPLSDRKAICIIGQNMNFGGSEVHTLGLIGAMLEKGYRVELIANRFNGYDRIVKENGWNELVRIIHTDLDGILYGERSDRSGWRQVLTGLDSEALIFPKGNYSYGQIGFLRECRRAFKRITFIEHLEPYDRPKRERVRRFWAGPKLGLWWYKRKIYSQWGSRYADRIIAVSGKVRDRLVADMGYAPDKLTVVRNGVRWRDLRRSDEAGRAFREQHRLPADAFLFGMLARLSREKGIDVALRALRLLIDECPDKPFCLVVAGDGYEADMLTALAQELGVQRHVRFIGFVRDTKSALSAYDVILFASRVEGLPLGLLEGMAAGCIPIVTRISGMPEAVNGPEIGWVVAPESPAEMAVAMKSALTLDGAALSRMRQRVAQRVQHHFDLDHCNGKLLEACEL